MEIHRKCHKGPLYHGLKQAIMNYVMLTKTVSEYRTENCMITIIAFSITTLFSFISSLKHTMINNNNRPLLNLWTFRK